MPGHDRGHTVVVEGHLERAEAVVTDVQRLGRIGATALTAAKPRNEVHGGLLIARALAPGGIGSAEAGPDLALVAAASLGPVPQPLWMMASIMVDADATVNAAGRAGPAGTLPAPSRVER